MITNDVKWALDLLDKRHEIMRTRNWSSLEGPYDDGLTDGYKLALDHLRRMLRPVIKGGTL